MQPSNATMRVRGRFRQVMHTRKGQKPRVELLIHLPSKFVRQNNIKADTLKEFTFAHEFGIGQIVFVEAG